MKKRVLKVWLEKALFRFNLVLFIFLACVNDFTLAGFFVLVGMIGVLLINTYILDKYGRKNKKAYF